MTPLATPPPDVPASGETPEATREVELSVAVQTAKLRAEVEDLRARLAKREQVDEARRHEEDLFALSFRLSPDFVVIVRLEDRIVIRANEALCALWGCTSEQVIGRPAPDYIRWVDENERLAYVRRLHASGECLNYETNLRLADGRCLVFNFSSRIVEFKGDRCVLTVMRDITARRRAEAGAAQLAALVEGSDDAIIGKDLNGIVTSWNRGAETIFGYSAREMIGQRIDRLIPPERLHEGALILERIRRGESVRSFDTVRRRADGTFVEVSVRVSAVRGSDGQIVGASKVARDITERKGAEEQIRTLNAELEQRVEARTAQLAAANEELEAFAYSVSHDLRAPARAIDGFSLALAEECGDRLSTEGRHQLEVIRSRAVRMGTLIDDLLAFSRLNRQEVRRGSVDMRELVDECLAELGPPAPGRRVEVRVERLPLGFGDTALLKQVWMNLLSNALKYTRKRERAEIVVGALAKAGGAGDTFFVRDNGAGFDMAHRERLFGVFQRLHHADDFDGSGVGLAIVKRIVTRHGGRVWAEAAPGRGATFFFDLSGGSAS